MSELLVTLAWLVPLVTTASGYVNQIISSFIAKTVQGTFAAVNSWIVSVLVTTAVAYSDSTLFGGYPNQNWLILGPVWGAVVAAISNGFFQLNEVKAVLELIRARTPK